MKTLEEQIVELEREDLDQARRMTGSEKLRAGGDLFDEACRWTLAGINHEHPDVSEEQAMSILRNRLQLAERLEQST